MNYTCIHTFLKEYIFIYFIKNFTYASIETIFPFWVGTGGCGGGGCGWFDENRTQGQM